MHKKILVDVDPIIKNNKTGIGFFLERLFENTEKLQSNIDFYGYYFNKGDVLSTEIKGIPNFKLIKINIMMSKLLSVCRRFGHQPKLELFIKSKYDLILFTNFVSLSSIKKTKNVLFVYDLCFLDYPEFVQNTNLKYLKRFVPSSILNSNVIVTNSIFTKSRIINHFPSSEKKIVVIPIPPAVYTSSVINESTAMKRYQLTRNKYILFVGTLEPRKNLNTLLDAYMKLNEDIKDEYSLVIVGSNGWKNDDLLDRLSALKNNGVNVIYAGYVSDEELNTLYANAACYVQPSHYEGFGMPLLESMNYSIPTIASDIPVFREIAGDASLYFNKDDPDDLRNKIQLLLRDKKLQKELVIRSGDQLKKFGWEDASKSFLKIIDDLLNKKNEKDYNKSV